MKGFLEEAKLLAEELGMYPIFLMVSSTLLRVFGCTLDLPLSTRDTVIMETLAICATVSILGNLLLLAPFLARGFFVVVIANLWPVYVIANLD